MHKFTEQNILHSAFVTAYKPPLISHMIFPNMPICIQTYTLWYFFAPQICDAGVEGKQVRLCNGVSVWQKNLASLH